MDHQSYFWEEMWKATADDGDVSSRVEHADDNKELFRWYIYKHLCANPVEYMPRELCSNPHFLEVHTNVARQSGPGVFAGWLLEMATDPGEPPPFPPPIRAAGGTKAQVFSSGTQQVGPARN